LKRILMLLHILVASISLGRLTMSAGRGPAGRPTRCPSGIRLRPGEQLNTRLLVRPCYREVRLHSVRLYEP
jgi:hypothetical protein